MTSEPSEESAHLVIGAGPAAVAAAHALVEHGLRVVVIDVGLELEDERKKARERLANTPESEWTRSDLELIRYKPGKSGQGLAAKQLFGSDVVFRDDRIDHFELDETVGMRPSYAVGGLSNVWGAGLLTYTDQDLESWPIGRKTLETHARQVLNFVPYAASPDGLSDRYPLLSQSNGALRKSDVAQSLLARFDRRADALHQRGLIFGGARLAVRTGEPVPEMGCSYCGRCLDGCPYDHIYSSAMTIIGLRRRGSIEYRRGLHVRRVSEDRDGVAIDAWAIDTQTPIRIRGARVFLAAGSLSTTLILQRSGLLARTVRVLDSQTVYMPFIWTGRVGRTGKDRDYALAQAFVVLDDPAVSSKPIHLSLYTYNDGLVDRARALHPRVFGAFPSMMFNHIAHRIVTAICFLHSDDSHALELEWREQKDSARLASMHNPKTPLVLARLRRALVSRMRDTGLVPLVALSEVSRTGGGYHIGGSMPMAASPSENESDLLGRPYGSRLIHVVDATVFPSIPAGTIALPAMANAHRIATEVARGSAG